MRRAAAAAQGLAGLWLAAELSRGGVPWTAAFALALAGLWGLYARHGGAFWSKSPDAATFLACLVLYLSTFRWRGGDDIPTSLLPLAVLRHGSLALDKVLDPWLSGKSENFVVRLPSATLSIYPVAGGLLALPVYLIPAALNAPFSEPFLHNLSKLSAALITAGSAVFLRRALVRVCSPAWAWILTVFYAAGSFAFSVSSQALWQHGPSQLGLALGLWGLVGRGALSSLMAGLGLGLSAAARPDSALIGAAAALYLITHDRRRLPGFLLGAALPLALTAFYWLWYTGVLRPPETEFQARHFVSFRLSAFLGLLLSPTRGLLWFFPLAAFGAWGALRLKPRGLGAWLLAACAATWVLLAHYKYWTAGMTFGPRHFAGVSLVLCFLCAGLETALRGRPLALALLCGAGAFGVLTHACGAYLTWPGSQVFAVQEAEAWRAALHPALFLFSGRGGLGGMPAPLRWVLGLAAWGGCAVAGARAMSALEDPGGRSGGKA